MNEYIISNEHCEMCNKKGYHRNFSNMVLCRKHHLEVVKEISKQSKGSLE